MASRPQDAGPLPPPAELAAQDFELVVRRLADELAFGSEASRYVGSGLEFAASRPYEPGDSMRSIDWRVSARTGDWFVRQCEAQKRVSTYIVVDTSASMSTTSRALSKHALAVWLAATLGVVAQRRLSPVALLSGGERELRSVPSLRRGDLWRALEELRAPSSAEGTRLAERIRHLGQGLPAASLVLVLSDLHDPEAVDALGVVAQRHDVLALQLRDPAERGRLGAGFLRAREAETGRRFLAGSRSRFLEDPSETTSRDLARAGVDHVLLDTEQPFLPRLRHHLGARAHAGRRAR